MTVEDTKKKENPPASFDLSEIEALKLAATTASIEKLSMEIELISARTEEKLRQLATVRTRLIDEYKALTEQITEAYSLDAFSRYKIDLSTRKGTRNVERAPKQPPVGP